MRSYQLPYNDRKSYPKLHLTLHPEAKLELSWRLSHERRQDLCDRERREIVSKCVLRSCACFCLISGYRILVSKGPRSPKHIATLSFCDHIFTSVFTVRSGAREPCGDQVLRSRLENNLKATYLNRRAPKGCAGSGLPQGSFLENYFFCT